MRTLGRLLVRLAALCVVIGAALLIVPWPELTPREQESTSPTAAGQTDSDVLGTQLTREAVTAAQVGSRTHPVDSLASWNAAVAAAVPGDTILITANVNASLVYRGPRDPAPAGRSGVAGNPITITAAPGVWIDPGNQGGNVVGLDVRRVDHVQVVGVRVRNAQFGIRLLNVNGSAEAPVRVRGSIVTQTGHAALIVQGDSSNRSISQHVLLENNEIFDTGRTNASFGEGIYIGYGTVEWQDETANVTVRNNNIYRVGAEGVDIKPGTREILVEGNLIHDLAPISGGAISAHYTGSAPNPQPDELDRVVIRSNRIWNVNTNGVAGSNDWAVWVGHGGVEVVGNRIWGMRNDASRTRAVRVRALADFGPHPIIIRDNVFWTAQGWIAEGSPSGVGLVQASGNLAPVAAAGTSVVEVATFAGPIPALGQVSSADRGAGPGSAFDLASAPPAATSSTAPPATTAPPRTTAPSAAPTTTVRLRGGNLTSSPTISVPTTSPAQSPEPSSDVGEAIGTSGGPPSLVLDLAIGGSDNVDSDGEAGRSEEGEPTSSTSGGGSQGVDAAAPATLAFGDADEAELKNFGATDVAIAFIVLGGVLLLAGGIAFSCSGASSRWRRR